MATDFMDVAAHSVEVVRCTKASFRTLPGKNSFGIYLLFSKITLHESFLRQNEIKRMLSDFNICN